MTDLGDQSARNGFQKYAAQIADEALDHPIVTEVMFELRDNLNVGPETLEAYGIAKVATYAAQVACAITYGHDPDILRLTPAEANSVILEQAARATYDGVPTHIIDTTKRDDTN